ncbi:hypothetical protein [Anabaenopsis arnoldii]|uniref:Uncharacterized protein n=1 Tax=Anabaenopsis arnoldii TaxID=2152938 RepID=A0ABT5AQK6_9CYAN|nr:hypothetical protein [Anabaenopsis arnoldii]MDB9539192.1 hypothetical protein [Anabaenopsis arnoldii]MDH6091480.1 hypothetical protein [Anabaenopsis arnoldii]
MFKVLRAKIMSFGDALKKGLRWGAYVGLVLGIFIVFFGNSVTTERINELVINVLVIALVTCLSSILGCILALIILGIIGTLQLLNWLLCLLAGSLLSFLTVLISGLVTWVSIALIPILFLLREYLAEKSPKWIDQAIDNAMVVFLTSIFITGLTFVFQHFTGITLRLV